MLVHQPTLLVAISAALAIASAAAATIGVRQRLRRGVWWWIGANSALAAALVLHSLGDRDGLLAPLAAVLALQWPIVTLAGLRRFYSRGGSALPPWADWLTLGVAGVAAVGASLVPVAAIRSRPGPGLRHAPVVVYATLAVARLEDFATTPVLKSLVAGLMCARSPPDDLARRRRASCSAPTPPASTRRCAPCSFPPPLPC